MKKIILLILFFTCSFVKAQNIDPYDSNAKYAYSENTGWLNFKPAYGSGVHVTSSKITGYAWSENIGWINLSPNYGGIANDGAGNLSGYAWGENVGWINFNPQVPNDPTNYHVKINLQGKFYGYAWGENIGWIKFDETNIYTAQVCIVNINDLYNFTDYWLTTHTASDLDNSGTTNINDFGIFADYWLDYCPNNWQLK